MASSSDGESKRRFGRSGKDSAATKAPKAPGRLSQIKQVYQMTAKADPLLPWILVGTVLGILAICLLIGWLWGDGRWVYLIYMGVIGLPLGAFAATLILGWRAKKAAYKQIEGMPGSSLAALQELGRGWTHEEQPVATEAAGKIRGVRDMGQAALVFRAVGRPGVVLVCEGPSAAALRLAQGERKRIARVVGEKVPVQIYRVGKAEGDVSVGEIPRLAKKLDKALTAEEVSVVSQRLRSLGHTRPQVPAGVDPRNARRPSRKSLRGR